MSETTGASGRSETGVGTEREHHRKQGSRRRSSRRRRIPELAGLRTVILLGLGALFIAAPLSRGGYSHWGWASICTGAGVLLVLWLLRAVLRGHAEIRPSGVYFLLLLMAAVTALQLVPLGALTRVLSPNGVERWSEAAEAGAAVTGKVLSLWPGSTADHLISLLAALALVFVTANTVTRKRHAIGVAVLLVTAATVNAVVGMVQGFSDERPTSVYLGRQIECVTGTFVNRNHFALLMEMGILLALGLILAVLMRRRQDESPTAHFHRDDQVIPRFRTFFTLAPGFAALAMFIALLFSYSRGGFLSVMLNAGLLGLLVFRAKRGNWRSAAVFGIIGLAFALASTRGLDELWARFEGAFGTEQADVLSRTQIWRESGALLRDYWRGGVGFGALGYALPRYERGIGADLIAFHSHNDWLELLCEFGVPIGSLLAVGVVALLIRLGLRLRRQRDRELRWIGYGALAALGCVACHAVVDFGLRMPGNWAMAAGVLGLAMACTRMHRDDPDPKREGGSGLVRLPVRGIGRLATLVLCIAVVTLTWRCLVPEIVGGRPLETLAIRTRMSVADSPLDSELESALRLRLAANGLRHVPDAAEAYMALGESRAVLAASMRSAALRDAARNTDELSALLETLSAVLPPALLQTPPAKDEAALQVWYEEQLTQAAEDLSRSAGLIPTKGSTMARYARMLEWLEIVRNAPSRTASATAYRLANESYPNVAQTTLFCAQAAWRSYGRALREGDPDDQEALLNEALSLFRRTVEQNPSRAGQVYERLWSTDRNVAWLRAVTPDYIPCHEQLYRFLFSRRHLEEAVVELQLISDLNQAREDEGVAVWEEDRFDLARRDRRTRSEVGISVQKREILLMGLLSRWEERRERLDGFRARLAEQLGDQLASGKALLEQGEAHRARVQLDRVLVIEPFHADAVVTQARIERELGQDFDALQLLLRLVYHEQELPPEVVTQALELLQELRPNNSGIRGVTNLPPFPADRFLSTALRFRAGVEPVTELRDEFSELVDLVEKREVSIWVQMPLLDVYLGDAQARSGDTQAAVRSYAAALERCPTHLTAAQRLLAAAAADSDSVPAAVLSQARRLVQRAQPDTPMQVAFGDKAQLLGYTVTPREIPVVGAVEVTFHWLCTGDINRDYTISCAYYLGDDLVFTDSYKPGALGSDMPTWRVGEVISIRRQVAPTTLAARQRRGRLSPGSYDLRVSLYASGIEVRRLEPLVECRGPAFTIRR